MNSGHPIAKVNPNIASFAILFKKRQMNKWAEYIFFSFNGIEISHNETDIDPGLGERKINLTFHSFFAIFLVTSSIVIHVPTRELLAVETNSYFVLVGKFE